MIEVNAVPDVNNVQTLYEYLKGFKHISGEGIWRVSIKNMLSKKTATDYESAIFQYSYMFNRLGIDSTRFWLIEDVIDTGYAGDNRYKINKAHMFVSYVDDDMNVVWAEPWLEGHQDIRKYRSYLRMFKNVRSRFNSTFKPEGKTVIGEVISIGRILDGCNVDTLMRICNRGLEPMCFMGRWVIGEKKKPTGDYPTENDENKEQ